MKNRLLELRETLRLNQEDFGTKVGLSKASISALESGLRNITERHIKLICSEFNVCEDWLRNGNGEMFSLMDDDDLSIMRRATQLERDLFKSFTSLDLETREKVLDHFRNVFIKHEQAAAAEEDFEEELEAEIIKIQKMREYGREIDAEKNIQTSSALPIDEERTGSA